MFGQLAICENKCTISSKQKVHDWCIQVSLKKETFSIYDLYWNVCSFVLSTLVRGILSNKVQFSCSTICVITGSKPW